MLVDFDLIKSDLFFELFKKNFETNFNINKKEKILLGLSGGKDSMALLFLLISLEDYIIRIAHVNHKLRVDSDTDMNFVKSISINYNIPCYISSLKPEEIKKGENSEAWGREKRYKFFEEISIKTNIDWIATGHHGNDNAETILFNLSRQTGLSGLKGIAEKKDNIIRPFLPFSKDQINEFCTRNNIPYIDDASNKDQKYYRNYIRHSILKKWEFFDNNIINSFISSINYFAEWNNAIDELILTFFSDIINSKDSKIKIPYSLINGIPTIVIIRFIQLVTFDKTMLWKKHEFDDIKTFINSKYVGKKIYIKNKWIFIHDRYMIIGEKLSKSNILSLIKIKIGESAIFNNSIYKLSLKRKKDIKIKNNKKNCEHINWESIKDKKIVIRYWKNGDFFYPLGMKSRQKLSDFLINNKIDYISKLGQTVMTADDEIFWVCGQRISNWARVKKDTKRVVLLETYSQE